MRDHETDVIRDAQKGDARAFESIVKKYERRVLALAYQITGNTHDAEDVYQDTFMKVFNQIKRFRFESDFYTWLYRIAVNTAISVRRLKKRRAVSSIDRMQEKEDTWEWTPVDTSRGPEQAALETELRDKIDSSLESLSLMQRTVVILKYFQEFKIKDISYITGCSEGTVKNYLFRGTRKMKQTLSDYLQT